MRRRSACLTPGCGGVVSGYGYCAACVRARAGMVRSRVTLVAGPPCGGKTSLVEDEAQRGDLVVDLDAIAAAISGCRLYDKPEVLEPFVFEVRDALLAKLASGRDAPPAAWVVDCAPERARREGISARLAARVRLVMPPVEECHRRASAAGRPAAWHSFIDSWFERFEPSPGDEVVR